MQFQKVCAIEDITHARPKRIIVGENELVLFTVQGKIYAMENLCPHQQFALFHQSIPDGYTITCPMHSWSFDIRTGIAVNGNGRIRIYDVCTDGDEVYIGKPEKEKRFPRF
jgi:nitrite reductase/ring-hydroxylating ferredoxin subunit